MGEQLLGNFPRGQGRGHSCALHHQWGTEIKDSARTQQGRFKPRALRLQKCRASLLPVPPLRRCYYV